MAFKSPSATQNSDDNLQSCQMVRFDRTPHEKGAKGYLSIIGYRRNQKIAY